MPEQAYQSALEKHKADNLDAAENDYLAILQDDPHNADVLHLLSILYGQQHEYSTARYYMEQALKENSDSATFHNSMGNILKNLQEYELALHHFNEALRLQPENPVAQNNIGSVFYTIERFAEAAKSFREALRLNPDYPEAHYNLGLTLMKQNNFSVAITEFEETIRLQPKHPRALQNLAYLLQLSQMNDAAAKYYQAALRLDNHNYFAHLNLGAILTGKKKYAAAIRHFKRAINIQPNSQDALNNLGTIFLIQNNPAAALKYFLRLSQLVKDFDIFYNLGVIYMELLRYTDAIIYFNEALAIKSRDFATHTNLGAIYLRRNDYSNAALHYEIALSVQPDNQEIIYLLAAIKQNALPNRAPDKYLQNLFDQYAPHYEQHLQMLNYQVPQHLLSALAEFYGKSVRSLIILDLGCGTGMSGVVLKNFAKKLIGIDISSKMLAIAANKHVYNELQNVSIEEAVKNYHDLDLIVAADSLVYIGNLEDIFLFCKNALVNKGLFAFTIEKTSIYPYVLQHTARYAHAAKYIEELALKNNFAIIEKKEIVLRKQQNTLIEGYLFLLQT